MKIATDLEQSKRLAEILPLESADMWWNYYSVIYNTTPMVILLDEPWLGSFNWENKKNNVPAWSLAALLDGLPDEITTKDGYEYNLRIVKDGVRYFLFYEDSCGEKEDIDTNYHDDLVDAVYELILKLKDMDLI